MNPPTASRLVIESAARAHSRWRWKRQRRVLERIGHRSSWLCLNVRLGRDLMRNRSSTNLDVLGKFEIDSYRRAISQMCALVISNERQCTHLTYVTPNTICAAVRAIAEDSFLRTSPSFNWLALIVVSHVHPVFSGEPLKQFCH